MEIIRKSSVEFDRLFTSNSLQDKGDDCVVLKHLTFPDQSNVTDSTMRERIQIPTCNGLMLRLDNATGQVHVEYEPDFNFNSVHPNCFAPKSLTKVGLLKGGGSGTAVFEGSHPQLGKVIMKHAGPRDTEEVMSLATISKELLTRGRFGANEAAAFLRNRIPQFLFCFISPRHVRDRALELWGALRGRTLRKLTQEIKYQQSRGESDRCESTTDEEAEDNELDELEGHLEDHDIGEHKREDRHYSLGSCVFQVMKTKLAKRELWICGCEGDASTKLEVHTGKVILHLPNLQTDCIIPNGYDFLDIFTDKLARQQEKRTWKCTLAQTNVGGPNSVNGATVLVSGGLKGNLLKSTIKDFVKVMNYLRQLTMRDERKGIHAVREELKHLESLTVQDVTTLSKASNEFVGTSILKNFKPKKGRFPLLRDFGSAFRNSETDNNKLILTDDEELPAYFLGKVLRQGSEMNHVFVDAPSPRCVLDYVEENWMGILKLATSFESNQVNDCIWTCGLTDAGLHNTFVDRDRGLHLFDLGAPQLMPMPAFLTKFLMSFFHTLGMEESNDNSNSWVVRFEAIKFSGKGKEERLRLTRKTKSLLPYLHKNFEYTMKHMIEEVFEGDEAVRELLLTYTTLQLLSDASFCLSRWEEKGGGRERSGNHNTGLCKWLWRSLWDLYIASDVYNTLLLPIKQKRQRQKLRH